MSAQGSGGYEVYKACDSMFNDLIKNNKVFRDYYMKNECWAVLSRTDDDRLEYGNGKKLPKGYDNKFFSGIVDEEFGESVDGFDELYLTDIFMYEKEDAYLYLIEVTIDYGNSGSVIMMSDDVDEMYYPTKDEILVKKGSKDWSTLNKVPSSFIKALLNLYKLKGMGYSLIRLHMVGDDLCVSFMSPLDGETYKYTEDDSIKSAVESLMSDIKSLGKPIKDVYYFAGSEGNKVRVRKCPDGEYVLVVS